MARDAFRLISHAQAAYARCIDEGPLEAWPGVPTRVLIPREDRLFPIGLQRRVARERLGLEIDEMAGGHVPMLARPGELAQPRGRSHHAFRQHRGLAPERD